MGCCGNKKCDLPKEELNLDSVTDTAMFVVKQLADIAKTGDLTKFVTEFGIERLANIVAVLASEVRVLRALTRNHEPKIAVTGTSVVLQFGPDNVYTLALPAATHGQRKTLRQQFLDAAAQLDSQTAQIELQYTEPQQQQFKFVEHVK